MHPEIFRIMDDIKVGLQYVFQTENPWTLVISGPGHLAMEAVLVNLLEQGDTMLVGVNGLWGDRVADLAFRIGAKAVRMETEPGNTFSLQEIEAALVTSRPKVLFLVHSESSTGVMQNLDGVGDLCRKYGCLLAVDTVASLGGVPFSVDKLKIDAIYTGSQKVIGAPPGIAPISFGPRAVEVIKARKTPVKSFLLDMKLLSVYWACSPGDVRFYHHTPPINLFYGLREALTAVVEEGLPSIWRRHEENANRLRDGILAMGLELFVKNPADRLPTVTTIKVPEGLDWKAVTKHAMEKFDIEIAGGLGLTAGRVFRIGLMGYNAYPEKVDRVLAALKDSIKMAKY
jgi:alanine-glyoxylate transaminase/serine-glyoxylate transaminase/serine-pyruvate transaminase